MFWGLILKSNKKYTQTLEKSFHLSQASLDHSSSDNEPVQVMYTQDDNSYLLCTLQKGKVFQCSLDLNFRTGDKLCFATKGNGIVHLTGFLTPEEDEFDFMDEEDSLADMDESDLIASGDLRKKLQKKAKEAANGKKQPVQQESDDEEEEDSDDEDAELGQDSDDDAEGSDDGESDLDDSDQEEEDDDSDEEEVTPPAKQIKLDSKAQQNGKKQKNGLENGAQQPKQKEKSAGGDGKIQKLQGGLMIQDLKVGAGAEAKVGKKIQVYYEGRLKSNNKIFDATKQGPGFKMTLGRGEVIKGWDLGLAGMKVGGKRRLICPPQLAYGQKGNPPVIPQNSTLVFDVELKNVL